MAQSINTKVDMVVKGTSFHGMNNYGNIMVGDKGFEYYNGRKVSAAAPTASRRPPTPSAAPP